MKNEEILVTTILYIFRLRNGMGQLDNSFVFYLITFFIVITFNCFLCITSVLVGAHTEVARCGGHISAPVLGVSARGMRH